MAEIDRLYEVIKAIPADGWRNDDGIDTFVDLARQLMERGLTESAAMELLESAYDAVAGEFVPAFSRGDQLEPVLTANEWHLLQSMLQQRIRESEIDGIDENHPAGQAQRELSRKLLHHWLRMQRLEHPRWGELPEPLRSMSYQERLGLSEKEWSEAFNEQPAGADSGAAQPTFNMIFTGVHGGPCPVCHRTGELVGHSGTYNPGGVRTIVHRDESGEHVCDLPMADGVLWSGPEPRWWYEPKERS